MRNIELKARLRNRNDALRSCRELGAVEQGLLYQVDTYFRVPDGRLKLRETQRRPAELIFYRRPDEAGPKGCDYVIAPADAALKGVLSEALGVWAVVEKRRTLYLWGNVRIHLDLVSHLGEFLEFEAVMGEAEGDEAGLDKVNYLMNFFGIQKGDLLETSYLEMMLDRE